MPRNALKEMAKSVFGFDVEEVENGSGGALV